MLSEIELLADDIGILNHGRLLFEGSLEDLKFTAHEAGFENDNLESIPVLYLLTWTLKLFTTMIPAISCMWAITILFEKPLLSMGLNLLLIIPGVLVANTPLWIVYPYCYSGYVVSNALHTVTTTDTGSTLSLFSFVPCAVIISAFAICVSVKYFGRKEMR